ncbi:hypothetical protein CASFOL_017283 [Castilleja foliolosa]|uniref:Uncharacterized protein n=1 Tax=Castilleja foliolosa TaxID=1961234 RepID=A0ABD3DCS2_9LAMI
MVVDGVVKWRARRRRRLVAGLSVAVRGGSTDFGEGDDGDGDGQLRRS